MEPEPSPDPFRRARETDGILRAEFQGETLPMLLRHADVRRAAKDWGTFSSDAPYRVPIPSEENVRSVRQLPIETDPPEHTDYRALVAPIFDRPKDPAVAAAIAALVDRELGVALARGTFDAVREFALPLQSRALAHLLNVPESEAEIWIGWGTHVFRDGPAGEKKGADLERYLHRCFARAAAAPGEDFFSVLNRATFRGRPLTQEEKVGFANLAFAGGRDTVIQTIVSALAYLGRRPEALAWLREDPARIVHASEEFFRVFMPLTHIGRVCPVETPVGDAVVPAGGRVSLGWAAANRDATVFPEPDTVKLDRKPNPHLSFGFGPHLCLGAPHARLILRTLLGRCAERLAAIEVLAAEEKVEREVSYARISGYEKLTLRLVAR
jgi:cytochrome P450